LKKAKPFCALSPKPCPLLKLSEERWESGLEIRKKKELERKRGTGIVGKEGKRIDKKDGIWDWRAVRKGKG
jgi:hypothetical protein